MQLITPDFLPSTSLMAFMTAAYKSFSNKAYFSHHAKTVSELLNKAAIPYMYLPPYNPDLNPIEEMWSKMKAILRKRKIRVAPGS